MFSIRNDLTGLSFGYLKVISYAYTKNKRAFWNCECICGNNIIKQGKLLSNGHIKSCGCMKNKMVSDAKIDNMQGKHIGRLTFVERIGFANHHALWLCKCDCGKETIKSASAVKSKKALSCGCLFHDNLVNRNTKHNCSYTSIYRVYHDMIYRCYKDGCSQQYYKLKGIKVCKEWLDDENGFQNFYNWAIENGYREEKSKNGRNTITIDRIDNDGNYEPKNCRWVNNYIQANNKSSNLKFVYNGLKYTMAEFCRKYNIDYDKALRYYHKSGNDIKKLVKNFNLA